MRAWFWWSVLALAGCEVSAGSAGEACTRSTQCASGLACIEGRCSSDLSAVAEASDVPDLAPAALDAGDAAAVGDAAADAAAGDAASTDATAGDAAASDDAALPSDAAVPADAT